MQHTHQALCAFLEIEECPVVSRAHLPLVLQKVNLTAFEELLFSYYGVKLSTEQKKWFAADGKELRGSIAKGNTRGEAVVQIVDHAERSVAAQAFYNGRKESEKPTLRNLLAENQLLGQYISIDALHADPTTLSAIAQAHGWFLVALKDNQPELNAEMQRVGGYLPVKQQARTLEKGHGRIEERSYQAYDVSEQYIDPRWQNAHLTTLIKVERSRTMTKTGEQSIETAWFLSNAPIKQAEQLFTAVRRHWSVEVSNHLRDVTLKEDQLKTKQNPLSRLLASFRTLTIKLLKQFKPSNMIAQIEHFQDDFTYLLTSLRNVNKIRYSTKRIFCRINGAQRDAVGCVGSLLPVG
jgi:predicted transposase YbfD/YdcC